MQKLKKITLRFLAVSIFLYLLLCTSLYFFQEKLIFFPSKLDKKYVFSFDRLHQEVTIPTNDNINLHGVLFYAKNLESSKNKEPKKLVFYLHGNVGRFQFWENIANVYTNFDYDVFVLDYRGYGKSEGKIHSQKQFFDDIQMAYNFMRKEKGYHEENIVVVGYSVGTAAAAMLASQNAPKALILKAPYFSLTDMTTRRFPFVPTFLLKYEFHTAQFLAKNKVSTTIFHGTNDKVIPYESSLIIKKYIEGEKGNLNGKVNHIDFITLPNQGHARIHKHPVFLEKLKGIL